MCLLSGFAGISAWEVGLWAAGPEKRPRRVAQHWEPSASPWYRPDLKSRAGQDGGGASSKGSSEWLAGRPFPLQPELPLRPLECSYAWRQKQDRGTCCHPKSHCAYGDNSRYRSEERREGDEPTIAPSITRSPVTNRAQG
jgi:hypothetical protein